MKIKNDMIGYPIIILVILISGLLGAAINGIFGIIIFIVLAIPGTFLVDSFLVE
jgi:hypothetical protein|tara:strand:+ start:25023 stop:25184 length:162 start_codon:yes stop_codon:yes gene_type:complete